MKRSLTVKSFEWIALAGALAWLPYIFTFLKDIFLKPKVRIITAKKAELGFTTLGPILNLRVAFAVENKDIVISGIKICLKHETGEEKVFNWHGVVQNVLQMNNPDSVPIPFEKELSVLAIKLSTKDIEERFIRFQDTRYHITKEEFESKVAKKMVYIQKQDTPNYEELLSSEEMSDLCSFIKQSFTWKKGKYLMEFKMESPANFVLKNNKYYFELSPLEIDNLQKNKELIEKSYEHELKPIEDGQVRNQIKWMWTYPVIKA